MPNSNYERGVRFERQVKEEWNEKGYVTFRTAGSHGAFDIIAVHPEHPTELIQCKVLKDGGEKQAFMMIRKFKLEPPLSPSKFYHQTMEVYSMADRKLTSGTV